MISNRATKSSDPASYQALLDENYTLKEELEKLKARLQEAEELKRAIQEGDLDALVIYRPEGELIFTLDSADKAYRALVETMNEGTVTLSNDGTILYCNRRFAELMKMPPQAIVGTSIYQFIAPENIPTFKAFLKQEMITGEINLVTNGGTTLPIYLSVNSLKSEDFPSPDAWCLVVTDLTEQKKNEEKVKARAIELEKAYESLKESEEGLADAQKIAHIGSWDWDIVTDKVYWSDEMYRIFGLNPQGSSATYDKLLNYVHPDDRDYLNNAFRGALKGEPHSIDYRIILADGEERIVHSRGKVTFDEKRTPVRMRGTIQDITERKKAEEMLKESEGKLKVLFNLLPVGVSITDKNRNILDVNLALEKILGLSRSDLLKKKYGTQKYIRSDGTEMPSEEFPSVRALRKDGSIQSSEMGIIKEDGSTIWTDVSAIALPFSDGRVVITTKDITEGKKAEKKIEHLANIVESSGDAIITKSLDGIVTSWNKGAEQIYGYSAEEVIGKPISILDPSMLVGETVELAELIKQGDKIHNYETLRLRKDGTIINVSLTLSPVYDAPGEVTAISVIARNITKSKNAEKELQQREETYRLVTEQTGQIVYEYDLKTNKNKWAGAIEEVTGYNFEEFQKLGKDFWTENILDSDPNRAYEKSQDKKTGDRFKEELRLRRKDGTYGYIENSGVYLMDNDGQSYRAIGVLRDITEKREAEEALKKIDKMRIKEIHHRIKNNLQVISSLLDLEANKFSDEKILESFKESRNRVVSMALIHEELYKGNTAENLDFAAYLQKLSADLFNSYRLGNDNISLNLDLEKVYLDMDTAIPLGIIVNELVSNALKHAFPAEKEGEIQISLCKKGNFSLNLEYSGIDADCKEEESFQYLLAVEDNGKGIPEEIELQNTDSLGLQLVNILVEQIDGQIELKRDKGTKFTILFSNIER